MPALIGLTVSKKRKPQVQAVFAFRLTAFERPAAHYRRDQAHLAFGGGSDEVVTRFVGMAGFDAVDVQAVIPQQAVTVQLADAVESELFLTIDGVLVRYVADQRSPISAMSRAELYCPSASRP